MEITGIRIKNKDIYIKAPYGELFAANSGNTTPVGNNFIILKNATILLNDIGGETLISYGDAKTAKRNHPTQESHQPLAVRNDCPDHRSSSPLTP